MPNPFDPTSIPVRPRLRSRPENLVPEEPKTKHRPLASSLVASAKRMTGETRISRVGASSAGWQADAWDMFDLVGEQHFLVTTLASRLSQARLYVGKKTEEADSRPSDDPDLVPDEVFDVFESFGGSDSARSQMLRRMAINLQVPGDLWLVGIPASKLSPDSVDDTSTTKPTPTLVERAFGPSLSTATNSDDEPDLDFSEPLEWRVLSIDEISSPTPGEIKIKLGDEDSSDDSEGLTLSLDEVDLVRIWQPHPRKAWEADSPTKASLPVLRELVGLTMHVSAQIDSRLAGPGILVVPQSAQRALAVAAGYDDEDDADDVFLDGLMEAMTTAINDRGSPTALVPLVVTVPDEVTDSFNHISFANPLDSEARELRDEAIRRLALGQDAPPEVLLGTDGMNHWGAWLVNEEVVTTHLEPPLALICDALTIQFLWPTLEAMGVEDYEEYVIWYDVDHLISRPTRSQDAAALYDKGELSGRALREASGFEEGDAPYGENMNEENLIVLDMLKANPALAAEPGVPFLLEQIRALIKNESMPAPPTEVAPEAGQSPEPVPNEDASPSDDDQPAGGAPSEVAPADVSIDSPLAASSGTWDKIEQADSMGHDLVFKTGRTGRA